jgi:hypothetical protein
VRVVPGFLEGYGSYTMGYALYEVQHGSSWLLAPALTPGVRLRPSRGALYVSVGARFGVAVALGNLDVWQCPSDGGFGYCDVGPYRDGQPTRTPDRTSNGSAMSGFYGGELGIGSTLGADAEWDFGFRVSVDNLSFSGFFYLDRRLL